jgi:hypothetical protein
MNSFRVPDLTGECSPGSAEIARIFSHLSIATGAQEESLRSLSILKKNTILGRTSGSAVPTGGSVLSQESLQSADALLGSSDFLQ